MIALHIIDIRKFTAAFLIRDLFDSYTLTEAQITTFCTFRIDGRLERSFFQERSADAASAASNQRAASGIPEKNSLSDPKSETISESSSGSRTSPEYIKWKSVRPYCYSLIRGSRAPLFFRFVFFYPAEQLASFLRNEGLNPDTSPVSGLCINLRFDGQALDLTTGVSMTGFTKDHTVQEAWDNAVRKLLTSAGIEFEEA